MTRRIPWLTSLCENSSFQNVGRDISRQPPSGRLLFSTPKSLLEAGCRLNSPPHTQPKAVFTQTLTPGVITPSRKGGDSGN